MCVGLEPSVNVTRTYLGHGYLEVWTCVRWDGYAVMQVFTVRQNRGMSNNGSFCMWGSVGAEAS
jgi:hypothetical protein